MLSSLMMIFSEMALKSLEKTFLTCKTSKRLTEDLHLKETDNLQLQFSKVNFKEKGDIRAFLVRKKPVLKFSQTERNF